MKGLNNREFNVLTMLIFYPPYTTHPIHMWFSVWYYICIVNILRCGLGDLSKSKFPKKGSNES